MTISFTLEQVLFGLGLITAAGGAFTYVAKVWAKAKQPNEEQNRKIAANSEDIREIKRKLEEHDKLFVKDLQRFNSMDKENHLVMEALFALLQHGIDGNNIEPMQNVKREIQNYLINK